MGWILILFVHVGAMGNGNSNALTTAEFHTQQTCQAAGQAATDLARATVKEIKFTCAKK